MQTILWFNMREEPVVYVNGRPFVLREQQRPMKNLQEYAGIDASRLERMEQRLKEDVLAEAGEQALGCDRTVRKTPCILELSGHGAWIPDVKNLHVL